MNSMRCNREDLAVYLVLDPVLCGGADGMVETALAAARNGTVFIQLRAPDWKKRRWVETGRALKKALEGTRSILLVDDQVDVAMAIEADGVHIGQNDMPIADVRRLLGPEKIIGLSITRPEDMRPDELVLADYLGIGPVWDTTSKPDASRAMGPETLRAITSSTDLPSVAIGGINLERAPVCRRAGVDGVAVVSAICGRDDPGAATARLLEAFRS